MHFELSCLPSLNFFTRSGSMIKGLHMEAKSAFFSLMIELMSFYISNSSNGNNRYVDFLFDFFSHINIVIINRVISFYKKRNYFSHQTFNYFRFDFYWKHVGHYRVRRYFFWPPDPYSDRHSLRSILPACCIRAF